MGAILGNISPHLDGDGPDTEDALFRKALSVLTDAERAKFGALLGSWLVEDLRRRVELVAAFLDDVHADVTNQLGDSEAAS